MTTARPRVTIISASIGAGHDGAARELARRLELRDVEVQRHDFLDLLPGRTGAAFRRAYAAELTLLPRTWGWLLGALEHGRAAGLVARLAARAAAERTLAALTPAPDVVVSTYPVASQVLGQLRRRGALTAPVVTFLTDMSVHRLWVADWVDLHLALHQVPARQAAAHGARVQVAGPAVGPAFHPQCTDNGLRESVRAQYGIPLDRPAALVVAGSWGVGDVEATVRDIAASGVAVPVALCAGNPRLRERLAGAGLGPALGWVDEMAPLIRACDVVVQNAGGLTSLEALACGRPVVSYNCVSGHGTTNARALDEAGLAVWARDPAALARALWEAVWLPAAGGTVFDGGVDPAAIIAGLVPVPTPGPVLSPAPVLTTAPVLTAGAAVPPPPILVPAPIGAI
jgi:UDP-N-acetylglucosamine:LPS N-acetylglucosamine transferase